METSERRAVILKILCRRRHETIKNLAIEFGVSPRTIRRDIEVLSLTEPIYTQQGRYKGGVYVTENFNMDKMYFQNRELEVLHKVLFFAKGNAVCTLSSAEINILSNLIAEYTKPSSK